VASRGALLLVAVTALSVVGCGSTKYVTTTKTETSTATQTVVRTRKISSLPPITTTDTSTATVTHLPASTNSFSGNGGENIGTFHVSTESTVRWTCSGEIFQILDFTESFEINSEGHSGTSQLAPGTYHNVQVNADGNWTMQIVPNS
jgi:hypothetical protein